MDDVRECLLWLRPRIEQDPDPELTLARLDAAVDYLNKQDTASAIQQLRSLLPFTHSGSEEFRAVRSILFKLDGTHQLWVPPGPAKPAVQREAMREAPVTWELKEQGTGEVEMGRVERLKDWVVRDPKDLYMLLWLIYCRRSLVTKLDEKGVDFVRVFDCFSVSFTEFLAGCLRKKREYRLVCDFDEGLVSLLSLSREISLGKPKSIDLFEKTAEMAVIFRDFLCKKELFPTKTAKIQELYKDFIIDEGIQIEYKEKDMISIPNIRNRETFIAI